MNPVNPNISANQALAGYQNTMNTYNQGVANYQPNLANYINQGINQTNLGGAANQQALDYNTFATMFANDPMGQQYMAQNFNNAGAVGSPTGTQVNTQGSQPTLNSSLQSIVGQAPTLTAPSVVSTMPQLTPQNVMSGWQGFTDPVYAKQAAGQDLSDVAGVMNAIQSLIGTDWNDIQSGATIEGQKQQTQLQNLMDVANMYMNIYNAQNAASGAGGTPSATELQQQTTTALNKDAGKMTLSQLYDKYVDTGQSDANSVLQAYKHAHNGLQGMTASQLQDEGFQIAEATLPNGKKGWKDGIGDYFNSDGSYYEAGSGSAGLLPSIMGDISGMFTDLYQGGGTPPAPAGGPSMTQPGVSSAGEWSVVQ